MKNNVEKRLFRLELMMYFVVGKLGFDSITQVAPLINTFWRTLW